MLAPKNKERGGNEKKTTKETRPEKENVMSTLSCSSLFESHYPTRAAVGVGRWRATNNFRQRIYRREQKSIFEDRTQDLMRSDEYYVLSECGSAPN